MDKIRINLIPKGMSIQEYRVLCGLMINWLDVRKVPYLILHEDWHDLPTALYIMNSTDAIMFKLTFGL